MEWTKNGALLALPNNKKITIPVRNNCPYANKEVLSIAKRLREVEQKQKDVRLFFANLYSASKIKLSLSSSWMNIGDKVTFNTRLTAPNVSEVLLSSVHIIEP